MNRQDLDALFVFGEHEDAGPAPVSYDTWFTNGRPGTTVLFAKDREPVSLLPMAMFTMDHLESTRRGDVMWIPPENIPTILGDLPLEPGMSFAFERNYAFGQHLAYLGGTVLVGEDEAIELNPYTAQILQAGRES